MGLSFVWQKLSRKVLPMEKAEMSSLKECIECQQKHGVNIDWCLACVQNVLRRSLKMDKVSLKYWLLLPFLCLFLAVSIVFFGDPEEEE
jgi:hypothetical protein